MEELNLKNFYVYCFYNYEWNEPFYIGKGSGNRYKQISDRSEHIKAILKKYHCESRIILNNLTEEEAYKIEKELKSSLKDVGKPIIDGEAQTRKEAQRKGIEVAKMQGRHLGRPKQEYPDNWSVVYSDWKAGSLTAKVAMEQLGLKRTSFYKLVKEYENKTIGGQNL